MLAAPALTRNQKPLRAPLICSQCSFFNFCQFWRPLEGACNKQSHISTQQTLKCPHITPASGANHLTLGIICLLFC